jgi:methylated-DNA-[protein]-cysteine S-methyltransferase
VSAPSFLCSQESHQVQVGSALRNNPFAPFVPCHRIIASDHYIGGFCGQWGLASTQTPKLSNNKKVKSGNPNGREDLVLKKLTLLAQEGVEFDVDGKVIDPESVIWDFKE